MTVEAVVLRFVDAINHSDVDGLAALMTDNHAFVDSDGSRISGPSAVLEGWSQYFSMMLDYRVVVQETFSSGDTVVLVGTATGMYSCDGRPHPENRWAVPAAWRAVVEAERVAVWQVFVNPEPILAAMRIHPAGGNREPG